MSADTSRPIVLITGASRRAGIGAAIAMNLAEAGWEVVTTYWRPYDRTVYQACDDTDAEVILGLVRAHAPRSLAIEADLADPETPGRLFDQIEQRLGRITALVLAHCESIDSDFLTTTVESFDRHFVINARAPWLLIREFATRYRGAFGDGRIIALTSNHTVGNLPYGASKGALDRIVLSATHEFKDRGITANLINPGATETGWISEEMRQRYATICPLGRPSLPTDCANAVRFLCSKDGGWINGQLIHSNGGVH